MLANAISNELLDFKVFPSMEEQLINKLDHSRPELRMVEFVGKNNSFYSIGL